MVSATVWLRQVIRIENTYYVSIPKPVLSDMGILRGSFLMVTKEKGRLVFELAEEGYRSVFRRQK